MLWTVTLRYGCVTKRRNRIWLNDCIFCNYKLQYPILTKWFAQIRYAFTEHNVGIQHYNKNANRAAQKKPNPQKIRPFRTIGGRGTSLQIRTSVYYPNFLIPNF